MKRKDSILMTERDQLKLLGGQYLMLVTLIINITTTVGVVWTVLKLGLNDETKSLLFDVQKADQGIGLLVVNGDLSTDVLSVADRLTGVESINSEHIFIMGDTKDRGDPPPGISLNSDHVLMQSKLFGPDGERKYSFKIDRETDHVEALNGAQNVRSIRGSSKNARNVLPSESSDFAPLEDHLKIESNDGLELSGNLGLTIYSQGAEIKSKQSISITSGERLIELRSAGGLFLPNIQALESSVFHSNQDDLEDRESSDGADAAKALEEGPPRETTRRQLCIQQSSGLLYQGKVGSC